MIYSQDRDANSRIQPFLEPGEQVLWTGRPNPNSLFNRSDLFLIPFGLLWSGFIVFWFLAVLNGTSEDDSGAGNVFPFFAVPFMLMGLYFLVGRFIYKRWRARRTIYTVTNDRVMVLTGSKIRSLNIDGLTDIQQNLRVDGSGSLIFGPTPGFAGMYMDSGMEFFGAGMQSFPPAFMNIPDARQVASLVQRRRSEMRQGR